MSTYRVRARNGVWGDPRTALVGVLDGPPSFPPMKHLALAPFLEDDA